MEKNKVKVLIPPIKSQGIKSKLVPWISEIIPKNFSGKWIEPFMGTGVVAFNVASKTSLLCDSNPHLIAFYTEIYDEKITAEIARSYLTSEGKKLLSVGEDYYYAVRSRFNTTHNPLDFLFLNRAGFNGMIRFNRKGNFNIPFCRKPQRFAQAYITKICNQIEWISNLFQTKKFEFSCQDYVQTFEKALPEDIIYCDPPYINRHVDYYNGWNEDQEKRLHTELSKFKGRFILSTWHHNSFRKNHYIETYWNDFNILTKKHFYHVGGQENNRNPMVEALITNFDCKITVTSPIIFNLISST